MTYADIRQEFDESLGYIRNDVTALCEDERRSLNYTVALLIGCGCEALADAGQYPSKERAFEELLPVAWRPLAKKLYDAVRNGLTHSFDTKHICIKQQEVQIHFFWHATRVIQITETNGFDRLCIGTRLLAAKLCANIDQFRKRRQTDDAACLRFKEAARRDRTVPCPDELWNRLKQMQQKEQE